MYQRSSRKPAPRRTQWTPNVVLSYRGETAEVFFHPTDEAAQGAFFANLRKVDEGSFKAIADQAPVGSFNGGSPVAILTVDNLKSALKAGEVFFAGFEPDGQEELCGVDGQKFQPVIVTFTHKDGTPGKGGNIGSFKTEQLAELKVQDKEVSLQASSLSEAGLATFINNLKGSPVFGNLSLKQVSAEVGQGVAINFQLTGDALSKSQDGT